MRDKIMNKLKERYEYAEARYGAKRILGVWLYGSQNYGLSNENSDIDCKVIYIPTFEELCFNKSWKSEEIELDGEKLVVKDLRAMREMWQKQNINFIEVLFTEYYIINPHYEQLFRYYFLDNREEIAHYDRNQTVKSISGQLSHTLNQEKEDNKKLYNAFRLNHFLQSYLLGLPFQECIKPKGSVREFLLELKYNCKWDAETRLQRANELELSVYQLVASNSNLESPCHESAAAALDKGVCEILKLSFDEKTITKNEFLANLTSTETKALQSIFKEIKDEGNISLSRMVDSYSISRPVYNNLLNKLKEFNIADVIPQGMKGTYIKVKHLELKQMAKEN